MNRRIRRSKNAPPQTESFCRLCRLIKPIDNFYHNTKTVCKQCANQEKQMKRDITAPGKPHDLAYTHVIRNRYTEEVFRYHILSGPIPDGYVIVYTAQPGVLLPKRFKGISVYEE